MTALAPALPTPAHAGPAGAWPVASRQATRMPGVDWLLAAFFAWSATPETVTGRVDVAGVPFRYVLCYIAGMGLIASVIARPARLRSPWLLAAVGLGLMMAALGFVGRNDTRFWIIDLTNYSGLVLGLLWGANRTLKQATMAVHRWSILVAALLALTVVGLRLGFVPAANEGARIYSYSLFESTAMLVTVFPFWWTAVPLAGGRRAAMAKPAAAGAMAVVVLASLVSASRSVLLGGVASVLGVAMVRIRGRHATLWVLLCATLFLGVQALAMNTSAWQDTQLSERMLSLSLQEEVRWIELELMFEDLEGHWLMGHGFGSRFESAVVIDGESLAYAPHVAILTLLHKGGLLSLGVLIVFPLVLATRAVLNANFGSEICRACAVSMLIYAVLASMSGGWNPQQLFIFGAMFAMAHRSRSTRRKPSAAVEGASA